MGVSTVAGEIGNGRATAILLARQGARVALVDFNPDWARETKRMIDEEGGTSEVIQADVTDEESCKTAVARTVELFGAVHILVNIGRCLRTRHVRGAGWPSSLLTLDSQWASAAPWATRPRWTSTPGNETCEST